MSNEDWYLQASKRTSNGDLINVRGRNAEEFNQNLIDASESAHLIAAFFAAVDDASKVGGPPAPQAPPAAVSAPPQQQYQQSAPQEAPSAPQGGMETITDKWGAQWTYGHPQSPQTPHGPAIIKKWRAQSGKDMSRWTDPAAGPKWFSERKPKVEKEQQWPGDWFNG